MMSGKTVESWSLGKVTNCCCVNRLSGESGKKIINKKGVINTENFKSSRDVEVDEESY